MLINLPMEGAGNGGSELPGSSDIAGQLVLALRNLMTEETKVMGPSTFDSLIAPRMDSILKPMRETMVQEKLRLERIDLGNRLNQFKTGTFTETTRMLMDPNPTPEVKRMELWFSKKISQPIYTCDEIKGEGNTWIEVVLIDSSTGNKVEFGPVASASIEIVALAQGTDDWTGEEFSKKIVTVEGKLPVLTVNTCKLQGGIVVLKGVKFRHHATQIKPTEFRLGARIVEKFDGIMVKEAKTESFAVKCFRNKYSKKNEIPNLTDKICVLKNIQRRGNIDKRLQAEGIDTVEKFLIQLLINPQELQDIAHLKGNNWEATVNHARKCPNYKMYWYLNSSKNSGIVFDIFGQLQWMYSEGEYAATDMLSENTKVCAYKLLFSAFEHWEDVTSFDDPDSLQQHLVDMKTSFHLSNSRIPGQYPGINPDAGASEMVNEFNNMDIPDPLFDQGTPISDTIWLARCNSFGIHDFEFFDDCHLLLDDCSSLDHGTMVTDSDIGCVVNGARIDGTGSVSAESEVVVPVCEAPLKWKTLF